MPDKPRQPPLARIQNKLVAAACSGRLRYARREQAEEIIAQFRARYTTVRPDQAPPGKPESVLKLWVEGFAVTPEEIVEGITGNFVILRVVQAPGGYFRIESEKVIVSVKHHPRAIRRLQYMPDWGHPVLRAVRKGRVYPGIAAARADLDLLLIQYPKCAVPGHDKLHLMVYNGRLKAEGKDPVEKITLAIRPQDDGGAIITAEAQKPKPPVPKNQPVESVDRFTTLVTRRRTRPKKPT